MAQGFLQVDVVSDANNFPITDANVSISKTESPQDILEELKTLRITARGYDPLVITGS